MINWEYTEAQAKRKAQDFAKKYYDNTHDDTHDIGVAITNAYFQGYMENAAERESLRAINERLQKAEKTTSLEDLI